MIVTNILDELKSFGVPEETAERIVIQLLVAGQKSVFASLGEVYGTASLEQPDLERLVATAVAQGT